MKRFECISNPTITLKDIYNRRFDLMHKKYGWDKEINKWFWEWKELK